jgi:hypothetical protein
MILFVTIFYLSFVQNIISSDHQDIHIEDYTIQLNKNNFNETINQHNDVLVLFHSKEDPKRVEILSVFKEAAFNSKHQGYDILFATVVLEASVNDTFWNIEKVPKIFYYSDGQKFKYREEISAKGIFNFIKQEFSKNFTQFYMNESLIIDNNNLLGENNQSLILFVGDPYKNSKQFIGIKRELDGFIDTLRFYWTNNTVLTNKFNVSIDNFALVSFYHLPSKASFNNGTILETNDRTLFRMKLTLLSKGLFENLDENNIERVIDFGIPSLVIIYADQNKQSDNNDSLLNEYTPVVENYRSTYWSFKLDINNNEMHDFLEIFNISKHDVPTAVIIYVNPKNEEELIKYKYDSNQGLLTRQTLQNFIENSQNGLLHQYISSEAIPVNPYNQNGVYRVVGENFKEYLMKEKNIVLLVCTDNPKDEDCVEVRNRFDSISRRLNASSNISFAFFEPIKNPSNIVQLDYAPDIFIFPNEEDKFSKMKMFAGNYTTYEIIQFIDSSVSNCELKETSLTTQEEEALKKEAPIIRRKINEEEDEENNDEEMSYDDADTDETKEQQQNDNQETINKAETNTKGNQHIEL